MSSSSADRNPVDRLAEEFVERFRKGERPSLTDYIERCPEHADEIRELFPALVLMEQLKPAAADATGAFEDQPAPAESHTPERLGDYRILREVGHGGMGIVYEAEQVSLGRRVALKILPPHALLNPTYLERFRREARAAAKLHHTNIVPVFGVGEEGNVHFYAMQFIRGEGLDRVLHDLRRLRNAPGGTAGDNLPTGGALFERSVAQSLLNGQFAAPPTAGAEKPDGEGDTALTPRVEPKLSSTLSASGTDAAYYRSVARVALQVADALAYAHRQGVLHRDVKPSNLLLDAQGTVWIADFGLAKADGTDELTHTGDIVGTIRFMAPERFDGRSLPQSDVYSLGLTLYELLTLRPAFDDTNKARLIEKVLREPAVSPRRLDPRVPRDLETVVLKCLAKEPADRYPTAEALAEDLRRFLADRPIKARRTPWYERTWRWARRNPAVAGLLASVLLLLVTVAVVSSVSSLWLKKALGESERANADANARLWGSYLDQARASRMTRQPGQRLQSLRAIEKALRLPLPPDRSLDELRTEAIAALCLPDIEVVKEWDGIPEEATAFAIDPAFERYAWGDKDGNVSVRRIEGDAELFKLSGTGRVWEYDGLKFSPDGRFLHIMCFVNERYRGRLWRLDDPQPVAVLDDDHVGFAFRPDSRQFAASYPDGSIRLYDLANGQEVRRFASGLKMPWLAWNPRHTQLALLSSTAWQVMDIETGKVLLEKQQPGGISAWSDWHPDGNVLAVAGISDLQIRLWDTRTGQLACPPLQGHKQSGVIVRFNHAGDRLVSNDWTGMLRLWDTRTGRQLLAHPAWGYCLQFSRDDGLLAADVSGPKVRLFRCRTGQEFRTLTDQYPSNLAVLAKTCVHPAGRLLAIQSGSGVLLADPVQGEKLALLPLPLWNIPLRFDPADGSLWTHGSSGVLRWPIRAEPDTPHVYRVGPPMRLAATTVEDIWGSSSDGNVVAIPNYSRGALLWQRDRDRFLPLGPQPDVRFCAVSPDGRWVATGSFNQDGAGVKVWDARSGQHVVDLGGVSSSRVGFSPDGKWLMTSGGKFRLWEVGTWREGRIVGESTHNYGFAFSGDGKLLALGDAAAGVVRLVVPDTGKELARLTGPEPTRLEPQCFTLDGAHLITVGNESKEVHVFDLRAIREQLTKLGLDWDAPPLPAAPKDRPEPLQVEVNMGNFREKAEADRLVASASRLIQEKKHAEALAALRRAIKSDPSHALAHNNLAWQLLVGPKELRDPKAALPLARKAVELTPEQSLYLNTLGVSLYRNGEFKEALSVLEKSLAASKGQSDAFDLFFLAMCQARLGDVAKAKDCFDRGVKWVAAQKSLSPEWAEELKTIRAEAEDELKEK